MITKMSIEQTSNVAQDGAFQTVANDTPLSEYIGEFIKDPNGIEDNVKQLIDESVRSVAVEDARANSMLPMTEDLISCEVSDTMNNEEIEISNGTYRFVEMSLMFQNMFL